MVLNTRGEIMSWTFIRGFIIYLYVGQDVTIDKMEFKNKMFQCVFQYLKRFDDKEDLTIYTYKEPSVEGDYSTCISTITKCVSCYLHFYLTLNNFMYIYMYFNYYCI